MKKIRLIFIFISIISMSVIMLKSETIKQTLNSRIEKVTIYQRSAIVTRKASLKCDPGIYSLIFKHLPENLNNDSLRISGKGTAKAIILNIQTEKVRTKNLFQKRMNELETKINQLREQKKIIENKLNILKKRESFFLKLSNKKSESIVNKKTGNLFKKEDWLNMLNFYEQELLKIANRRRSLDLKLAELNHEISLYWDKRKKNRQGLKKVEKNVKVDIEIKEKGELILEISYQVNKANWTPVYNLRLSSSDNKGLLQYSALIEQETGEDWNNIYLSLSTAKQLSLKKIPSIKPVFLNIHEIKNFSSLCGSVIVSDGSKIPGVTVELYNYDNPGKKITYSNNNGEFCFRNLIPGIYDIKCSLEGFKTSSLKNIRIKSNKVKNIKIIMSAGVLKEEIIIASNSSPKDVRYSSARVNISKETFSGLQKKQSWKPVLSSSMDVAKKGISTNFNVKNKNNIKSGKTKKVTIMISSIELKNKLFLIPRLSENAFLKARIKNISESPFLPGKLNLFYDGAFLNKTHMPLVVSNEDFDLIIGEDKDIKAKRDFTKNIRESKAILGKKRIELHGYTISVKNFGKKDKYIFVVDQIPITQNKKISVEIKKMVPNPQINKKENRNGIYTWKIHLKKGEKKEIKVEYSIKYPKNAILDEFSRKI